MQDFFFLKHFFQIQFVYLASYLFYPTILKTLNDFFFCHLLLKGGGIKVIKMFMSIATAYNIGITILNNINIFIYCYQCIKLKQNFLTTNPSSHFTCYTPAPQDALAGDHFKMTPHFKQLWCMDTFKEKRVVNRKIIYLPNSSFFVSYLYIF